MTLNSHLPFEQNAGRLRAANGLACAILTLAAIGAEFSEKPGGPTPLLLSVVAVLVAGFRIGRGASCVVVAVNVAAEMVRLYLVQTHVLRPTPDGGPPPAWHPLIAFVALTLSAILSSLISGRLHAARLRTDTLTRHNAALADANARLQALTTADPLTGVLNHRGLVAALDAELDRCREADQSYALLFVDIDYFKALNDGYGHAAGDAILQEFARVLRDSVRGVDRLGRWGGEEFVILLPGMDAESATAAAERVRAGVAEHIFPTAGGLRLTCSLGLSLFPEDGAERGPLLDAADRAMYAAKRLGRNQVRSADDPAVAILLMDIVGNGSREEAAVAGTVDALAMLAAARNDDIGKQGPEVAALAVRLCAALGLDAAEARMVGLAGRLHDIGKAGVPEAILHKAGQLSEDEWAALRRHPLLGADIVGRVPSLRAVAPLIRSHQERWDGHGFPDGLAGEAIPLGARVLAVANAYQAMTSDRLYHRAWEQTWVLDQIARQAGTQFDPRVVDALRAVLPTPSKDLPLPSPSRALALPATA